MTSVKAAQAPVARKILRVLKPGHFCSDDDKLTIFFEIASNVNRLNPSIPTVEQRSGRAVAAG
jgi:hypothetical protein